MAKTIIDANLTIKQNANNYVRCTVEMPASEYEAFIALAGLTDAVPTHVTTFIASRVTAGSTSGA